MPYKIYTDKDEDFICEVSVKNASLQNSMARIVLASDSVNLIFEGKVKNGKCIVPIKKVKGLLEENSSGKIHLEMVVDNMYFKPWHSDFVVEEHTQVKVKVDEQKEDTRHSKPVVEVKVSQNKFSEDAQLILRLCERFNINKNNISKKRNDFKQLILEYFKDGYQKTNKKTILNEVASQFK